MDGIQNVVKRVIPFLAASGVKTESTKVHPMVSLGKYCNHRSWVVPPTFRFWWVVLGFRFTPRVSSLARNISQPLDHSIRPVALAASEVESLRHLDFYLSDSLLDPRFLSLCCLSNFLLLESVGQLPTRGRENRSFVWFAWASSVLEDSIRRCSPSSRSKCWRFAWTHLDKMFAS